MTAPRAREQSDPPSPPDRRPPRRGGGSSPSIYAASAAGRRIPPVARHGLVRSARALAVAALLALSGALVLPATAQADVLVSNIGQATASTSINPEAQDNALQFTTGGNTGGYNLDSVELKVKDYENVMLTVSLYSDSSGVPGSSIFTFTNPTSGITANANNTFTAPANTTLMASTPYHIVVSGANDPDESSNIVRLGITSSNAEDAGGATNSEGTPDWAIADGGYFYNTFAGNWNESRLSIQIRVNGSAASGTPTPLPTDTTLELLAVVTDDVALVVYQLGHQPSETSRTMSVPNSDDEATVTATPNHASATVVILDSSDMELTDADDTAEGFQVALAVGENVIKVKVTAEDRTTTQTYTVTVTRAAPATPPTVTSVAVASAPQSGNAYHWGETIVFTVTFDEPVRVTGRPGLEVGLDDPAGASGSTVQARFAGLSESQRPTAGTRPAPVSRHVHFAYTVQPFDRDTDGVRIGANALRLASGDRIRSDATGADAELDHAALGPQSGHRVDGRTTVDGEPAAPVAGAGIRFVDRNGDLLETRADGKHRLWVPEGGSARYGLRLKTRPAKSVVLSFHPLAGDPDLDVPRDFASDRSIAPDEWVARTVWVRVEAAQDADYENGERVFAHNTASNDPNYHHLVLPDVVVVEVDDGPPCTLNPGDLWCGVVTVGLETESYGFNDFQGLGDLSDEDFDFGANSYTIEAIIVDSQTTATPGALTFTFASATRPTPAVRDNLVLHVGGAAFEFSDPSSLTAGRNFKWNDAGLDWSGKEYVILRLREASSASRSLRAWFESPPERHDGKKRVTVQVAFSEPIDGTPENVGEHGVDVEGGEVTSVSPVGGDAPDGAGNRSVGGRNAGREDREVVWEFEIEPDSDGDLTISLDAGRPCGEPGAICTADGRSLSEGISTTVEGPEPRPEPLTATFEGMPEAHDGESAFRFHVAFSENIGISYRSLREDAFTVTGGRVTRGRRVDDRRDLFEMTVEPDGDGEVTVTLPAGRECSVSGAICTKGGNRRQLTNTPAATVAGPGAATGTAGLTARFVGMPAEHNGTNGIRFRVAFSEDIGISYRALREDAFTVTGGRVTGGRRVDGRRDLFEMTVRPESFGDVTIVLPAGRACGVSGAICTKGEPRRKLTNTLSTTVPGPVAVSVADARAREGEDETIDFAVTLSRTASGAVTVAYATADGTATAGSDYTARQGKLTFAPGETAKTVSVPVLDDAHDEGEETMRLRLPAASGAVIADGIATGTIENSDPIPQAWLARFGRTVAGHVTDAIGERLTGPAGGGSHVTLGGQRLPLDGHAPDVRDGTGPEAADGPTAFAGRIAADADGGAWQRREPGAARSLTGRELLLGSSFRLAPGGAGSAGTSWTAWGRAAQSRFDGDADGLALDGDVTTFTLGADAAWSRWLAGVALAHSTGEGGYRDHAASAGHPDRGSGTLESTLTSVHPYARYRAGERLTLWGMLGYGAGDLTLTVKGRDGAPDTRTDTDTGFRMAAAGARGVLVAAGDTGGFELAARTDAQLVRMTSEKTTGLAATTADTSRLRLVLEGSHRIELAGGQTLTPTLEVGLRHDGGDAETGAGIEVGGSVRYADPALGLTAEAKARTLIAHEDSDYREWGASGSVRIDPGASGRGLSLTLAPAWGAASGGADRLWSMRDARQFAANDAFDPAARLDAEAGYGFGAFGGRGLMTPYAGLALSETGGRAWRTGVRWTLGPGVAFGVEGTRSEPANDDPPEHGLAFRATLRW